MDVGDALVERHPRRVEDERRDAVRGRPKHPGEVRPLMHRHRDTLCGPVLGLHDGVPEGHLLEPEVLRPRVEDQDFLQPGLLNDGRPGREHVEEPQFPGRRRSPAGGGGRRRGRGRGREWSVDA